MFRRLLNYFLNGLLLTIPVGLTLYLIYWAFTFLDDIIVWENKPPGIGLIILVVFITLVGMLGNSFIFKPISNWFKGILNRVPLLKTVYSSIKDLLTAFVGKKKKFDKPVLVNMGNGLEKVGFITDETLNHIKNSQDKVAVYFPFSFGVMGSLFIVNKQNVTILDENVSDIMKYIVSAGVADSKKEKEEELID